MSDENSAKIIPFGKYKGKTVDELLAADPNYVQWILSQNWLAEKFAELHVALLNRGKQFDDTPEHNKLQAKFLDQEFVKKFMSVTGYKYYGDKVNVRFEIQGVDVLIGNDVIVELKPSIGDDYPGIMRQLGRLKTIRTGAIYKQCCVIAEYYTGTTVSLEEIKEMFKLNDYKLIMLSEII